jgi:hypothetical protein
MDANTINRATPDSPNRLLKDFVNITFQHDNRLSAMGYRQSAKNVRFKPKAEGREPIAV